MEVVPLPSNKSAIVIASTSIPLLKSFTVTLSTSKALPINNLASDIINKLPCLAVKDKP